MLQPAVMFVGEKFDTEQDFKQAKSMLLDMFRGQQVGDGGDAEPSVDAGSRQQLSLQPLVVTVLLCLSSADCSRPHHACCSQPSMACIASARSVDTKSIIMDSSHLCLVSAG